MGGKKKSKQTDKTIMPEYVRRGNEALVGRATDILNRDYEGYQGPRVAGLSENERMAAEMARSSAGVGQGYISQGAGALGRLTTFDQANIGAYMNPYIENVVRNQQRGVNEAFGRSQAELERTRGMRGAFGGGRQTAMERDLSGEYLEKTGDLWDAGFATAFDKGADLWRSDMDRAITEAGAYGDLAGRSGQAAASDIRNLAATGLVDRSIEQAQMDVDYGDFLERRDWDVNNMGPLLEAMKVAPGAADVTRTSETKSGGSTLGNLVGAAASVAGFMSTGGMSELLKLGTTALGAFSGPAAGTSVGGMDTSGWSAAERS